MMLSATHGVLLGTRQRVARSVRDHIDTTERVAGNFVRRDHARQPQRRIAMAGKKDIVRDVLAHAGEFVIKHKGVWEHEGWETFLKKAGKAGADTSEAGQAALGALLESVKGLYHAVAEEAPAKPEKKAKPVKVEKAEKPAKAPKAEKAPKAPKAEKAPRTVKKKAASGE